jgi:hypothetical protein
VATTRTYDPSGLGASVHDIGTTAGLVLPEGATLRPRGRPDDEDPATFVIMPGPSTAVAVTARWGWPSVPFPVEQAALQQAVRLFARRSSPFGVAGSPELGSELRLLSRLDPDVEMLLGPYRRRWYVA